MSDELDDLARVVRGGDVHDGLKRNAPSVVYVQQPGSARQQDGARSFMFLMFGVCALVLTAAIGIGAYWWWHWNSAVDQGVQRIGAAMKEAAAESKKEASANRFSTYTPPPDPEPRIVPNNVVVPQAPIRPRIAQPKIFRVADVVSGSLEPVDTDHAKLNVLNNFDHRLTNVKVKIFQGLEDLSEVTIPSIDAGQTYIQKIEIKGVGRYFSDGNAPGVFAVDATNP